MEIDRGVLEVGPPINILQITKHGAKWIQKKAESEELFLSFFGVDSLHRESS